MRERESEREIERASERGIYTGQQIKWQNAQHQDEFELLVVAYMNHTLSNTLRW